MKLYNIVKVYTSTVGTGTVSLGSAVPSFITFATAGVVSGSTVSYAIEDGTNREVGTGVYTSGAETLTRTVATSTNSNSAIPLSGNAVVFITGLAADLSSDTANVAGTLILRDASGNFAAGSAALVSAVVPLVVGGTGTTSPLTLRSTSGVGTTGADIIFQTGNNGATEVMRVQNGGNVGIGTAAPQLALHVVGTQGGPATSGTTPTGTARFVTVNSAMDIGSRQNGNTWMQVTDRLNLALAYNLELQPNGGNVGIGTAIPGSKLTLSDANKTIDSTGNLSIFTANSQAANLGGSIGLGGVNGSAGVFDPWSFATIKGAKENATSGNFAGYFAIGTASSGGTISERMRIDSSGNVGIGTTSPAYQAQVNGLGQTTAALTDAGNKGGSILIADIGPAAGNGGALLFAASVTNGLIPGCAIKSLLRNGTANGQSDLAFSTRNAASDTSLTERVRILSTGEVGIGRFPAYRFDVNALVSRSGDIGANSYLQLGANATDLNNYLIGCESGSFAFYQGRYGGATTERMRIDSSGRVGIGTASPATSAVVDITSTTGALIVPRMTTTQRNALTAVNGMIIYNTTDNQMQGYISGSWAAM